MRRLCVIRYLEESHGTTTLNGQDGKDPKREDQEEELLWKLQAPDDRPGTDVRPLEDATAERRKTGQSYRPRTTGPARRTRVITLWNATQAQGEHKIIHARNFRVQPQAIMGSGIVEYVV